MIARIMINNSMENFFIYYLYCYNIKCNIVLIHFYFVLYVLFNSTVYVHEPLAGDFFQNILRDLTV